MRQLQSALTRDRHEARVGRREEIVVEGAARRDDALQQGRTRQGKVVLFSPGATRLAPGTLTEALIVSAGTYHLRGELTASPPGPRPARRLIPLSAD